MAFRKDDLPLDPEAHERLKQFSPIAFRCGGDEGVGQMHDISEAGCVVEFVYPLLVAGSSLSISLLGEGTALLLIEAVVHSVEGRTASVRFTDMTRETFITLAQVLSAASRE